MQVKMSEYLTAVKPDMQKLVELLKKDFAYVSVRMSRVRPIWWDSGRPALEIITSMSAAL